MDEGSGNDLQSGAVYGAFPEDRDLIFLLTKSVDLPILQRPEEDNFRYRGSHGFGMRMFMRVNRCFKSVQYTEKARQNRQPACATARGTPPSRTVLTSG
jgi:hypothetical protein